MIQHIAEQIEWTGEVVTKGSVSCHSGARLGEVIFKGYSDLTRGDVPCSIFCGASGCFEFVSGIYVWIPFAPHKGIIVAFCKSTSIGLTRFRDLCAKGHTKFC